MMQILLNYKVLYWFNLQNTEKTNSKDQWVKYIFPPTFRLKITKMWFLAQNPPSGGIFTKMSKKAKNTVFSGFAGHIYQKSTFK